MSSHTDHPPETGYRVAPWVAWRLYPTQTETRCAISDERFHTYTELEGASALAFNLVIRGLTAAQVAEALPEAELSETDVVEFCSELMGLGLLVDTNARHQGGAVAEPAPRPLPLEDSPNVPLENNLVQWVIDQGFLWSCHWEITYRCNESCVHCYNPGAAHSDGELPDRKRHELTTEEAKLTLDRLAELGVFRLTLSGGEAFLRQDLLDIVAHARSLGMSVDLYTNGLLLSEEKLSRLAELWPRSVSVSVYSDLPEQHDAITRVRGSHARSVACLEQLNAKGIKTAMKAVAFKDTADRHPGIRQLADRLGAALEVEGSMIHGQDGSNAPQRLGVTDAAHLIELAMTPGSPLFVGHADVQYGRYPKDRDATVCGAGVSFLHLDPEGNIMACSSLPLEYGNVRHTDIRGLWTENQRRQKVRSQRIDNRRSLDQLAGQDLMETWTALRLRDYHECGTHDRCSWCQKCPGKAMLEHGDPLAPSAADCRVASARMWAARLLEAGVAPHRVAELRGRYETLPATARYRSQRRSISEHAAASLLPLAKQHSAGGCGTCGSASFCTGEEPMVVESSLGLDAKGVTEAVATTLQAFESIANEYLVDMIGSSHSGETVSSEPSLIEPKWCNR